MTAKSVKPWRSNALQCTQKRPPMPSRLHPEDQKRVDQYLASPVHQVERRPFRVWILIALVVGSVVGLGLLSRLLAQLVAV